MEIQDIPVQYVQTGATVSTAVRDLVASKVMDWVGGYSATNAIFAFVESKLFADMNSERKIEVKTAAARHSYPVDQVRGLLRYLATLNLTKETEGDVYVLSPEGEAVCSNGALGYLRMYRGGYGGLMSDGRKLLEGGLVYGRDIQRDGYYVSAGSSQLTNAVIDAVPLAVLARSNFKTVVDLGCGAASFLIEWARKSPDHRGIGVDIDPHGIEAAKSAVRQAELSGRVELVLGNGFELAPIATQCAKADVFYSFAMEHEMLRSGEDAVLSHIDQMAELFPGKRYLLGEPMLNMNVNDGAFYWLHVLSKQGIPRNIAGWIPLLKRLKKARLESVYVPDHERFAAYFDIALSR